MTFKLVNDFPIFSSKYTEASLSKLMRKWVNGKREKRVSNGFLDICEKGIWWELKAPYMCDKFVDVYWKGEKQGFINYPEDIIRHTKDLPGREINNQDVKDHCTFKYIDDVGRGNRYKVVAQLLSYHILSPAKRKLIAYCGYSCVLMTVDGWDVTIWFDNWGKRRPRTTWSAIEKFRKMKY